MKISNKSPTSDAIELIDKSSPESQLSKLTMRSPTRQLRHLWDEFTAPLRRDALLHYAPSTRNERGAGEGTDFTAALREFVGLTPYPLNICLHKRPDAISDQIFDHLKLIHQRWPRMLAEHERWATSMHPDREISVSISVAAHNEKKTVYNTLAEFARQSCDSSKFEICLFINYPVRRDDGTTVTLDGTIEEINRALVDFPNLNISWRFVKYDQLAPIGTIRLHADASILLRHYLSRPAGSDHLILRFDADAAEIHPMMIESYLRLAERFPKAVLFRGPIENDREALLSSAKFLLCNNIQCALQSYMRTTQNVRQFIGGANSMYRASAYVKAGGYDWFRQVGEDVSLGTKIVKVNEAPYEEAFKMAGATTRVYSSARRQLSTVDAGYSPIMAWSIEDNRFQIDDPRVRELAPQRQSIEEFEREIAGEFFVFQASGLIAQTVRGCGGWDPKQFSNYTEEVLIRAVGLPLIYDSKTSSIGISNPDRFREILRIWRSCAIAGCEA